MHTGPQSVLRVLHLLSRYHIEVYSYDDHRSFFNRIFYSVVFCSPSQTTISPSIPPMAPASQGLQSIVQVTPVRPARKLTPLPRAKPTTMPIMRMMFFFINQYDRPGDTDPSRMASSAPWQKSPKKLNRSERSERTSAFLASGAQNLTKPLPHFIGHLVFLAPDDLSRQLHG